MSIPTPDPLPETLAPANQTPAHNPAHTDGHATLPTGGIETLPAGFASWPPGYEVMRELGRGGMGVVYLARQVKADRLVALKMILAGTHAEDGDLARFRTEAEAIARLQHPNIVQVFEVGEHQGLPFFSLEYCEGGTLARQLNGTPLEANEAARLVELLARAMQAAHDQHVIHRDLKPANVLLASGVSNDPGTSQKPGSSLTPLAGMVPKVTDFGLARKLDEAGQTRSGAVMGTPSYMAPEQADERSAAIGPAADVYALGAVLYECLTGRPPFRAATMMDTLLQVLREEPVPPSRLAKVPRDLETICLKCLSKEATKRYASALEMAEDLRGFQESKPITARPVSSLERGWRWCRRNPVVAGLLLTVFLTLGLGAGIATLFAISAEKEKQEAEAARDREKEEREKADRNLYVNRIALARREWEAGNLSEARTHLDATPPLMRGWEYHHLLGLASNPEQTLTGHRGEVTSVAISPDGLRIASGSEDRTVVVWNALTGQQVHTLQGHTAKVTCVAFSPDGLHIASGSEDRTVTVWDARTGQPAGSFKKHKGPVRSLAFSPDSQRIVSTSPQAIGMWNFRTRESILSLVSQGNEPVLASGRHCVAFSPDGLRLATGDANSVLNVRDAQTSKPLHSFKTRDSEARSIAFSPDGRRMAAGMALTSRTASFYITEDGQRIVPQSKEYTLAVWDVLTGQQLLNLEGHADQTSSVAFSPDGRQIVSGGMDRLIKLWDARTGELLRSFRGHMGAVNSVAFSADGKRVVSASNDNTVKVWPIQSRQDYRIVGGHHDAVTAAAFSPDGLLLVSGSSNGTLKVWNGELNTEIHNLQGHGNAVRSVAFSPDGRHIVSGGDEQPLKVWDVRIGRLVRTLEGHADGGCCVAFCSGQCIVSGGKDRLVKVWDAETGRLLHSLPGHRSRVRSVACSPDGQRIVSGSGEQDGPGEVKLWDANTGRELSSLVVGTGEANNLAFSPDGKRIVVASGKHQIGIRDAHSGAELRLLQGHTSIVSSVAFSPDGRRIVSGSWDRSVRVWDAQTGQELLALEGPRHAVYCVAMSPDGKRIAAGGMDNTIHVWDSQTTAEADRAARLGALAAADPGWHRKQAAQAEAALDPFAAAFHLRRLSALEPWDADLHIRLVHQLVRLEQRESAALQLLQALALNPVVRLWPVDGVAYTRGWHAAHRPDWRSAAVWLELAVHQPKPDERAWPDLLLARLAAGQFEAARKQWRELADATKENEEAAISSLVDSGQFLPLSAQDAAHLVKLAEGRVSRQRDPSRLVALGAALYRAARYQDAARILEEAIKVEGKGGQPDAWLFLALAHHRLGELERARQELDVFKDWYRKQQFSEWQPALRWKRLLDEATALIRTMPPARD